jgi:hypothetical protein
VASVLVSTVSRKFATISCKCTVIIQLKNEHMYCIKQWLLVDTATAVLEYSSWRLMYSKTTICSYDSSTEHQSAEHRTSKHRMTERWMTEHRTLNIERLNIDYDPT